MFWICFKVYFDILEAVKFSSINKAILNSTIRESNYYYNNMFFIVNHNKSYHKILLLSGGISNNTRFIKKT